MSPQPSTSRTHVAGLARWTRLSRHESIAIAIGGALGAAVRWAALSMWVPGTGFAWPVFAINVIGSGLLGLALAEEWTHPRWSLVLRDGVGIGFCGGLTTFSTFAVEIAGSLRSGEPGTALLYAAASVVASVLAVWVAALLLHRVRSVRLPVEGPDEDAIG